MPGLINRYENESKLTFPVELFDETLESDSEQFSFNGVETINIDKNDFFYEDNENADSSLDERLPINRYENLASKNTFIEKNIVLGNTVDKFNVIAEWTGVVLEVHDSYFMATVRDMNNDSLQEEIVELDIEDLSNEDAERLSIGSIFYWAIGYKNINKTKYKTSKITVRYLRPLSEPLMRKAEKEAAAFGDFFAQFNK